MNKSWTGLGLAALLALALAAPSLASAQTSRPSSQAERKTERKAEPSRQGAAGAPGRQAAARSTAPRAGAARSTAARAQPPRADGRRAAPAARQASSARSPRSQAAAQRAVREGRAVPRRAAAPVRRGPSLGQVQGLRATDDELDLNSSVALLVDQETQEVLFSKNAEAVLPIASITKLMTALVVTEAGLPLDEVLTVTAEDAAVRAGSRNTLVAGARLTRGDMLHLALMASENRAAHLLGRTFPGGLDSFVAAMNAKARELGMNDTRYVEPTGLSSDNRSTAHDLALLVRAAYEHPVIRQLSTSLEAVMPVGRRQVQFHNTNGLVRHPEWEIGLQKTGYIAAAGRCVALQAELAGRKVIMVLLDSAGRYARMGDAERLRKWFSEVQVLKSLGFEPR
jgi:D-alanyl-D-alanine endopeptidase (penicillin-binding protein 7)